MRTWRERSSSNARPLQSLHLTWSQTVALALRILVQLFRVRLRARLVGLARLKGSAKLLKQVRRLPLRRQRTLLESLALQKLITLPKVTVTKVAFLRVERLDSSLAS
jgi:hypothetical protein